MAASSSDSVRPAESGAARADASARSRLGVVIAGAARDCAAHLPDVLASMDRLAARFAKAAIVLVENDSRDATRSLISDWAAGRGDVTVLHPSAPDLSSPHRTIRIAACRNAALDAARKRHADLDLLIMLDMDEPNRDLEVDRVIAAVAHLEAHPELAAVFANSSPVYYDMFALRHPVWCPNDCWEEARAHTGRLGPDRAVQIFVASRMLHIDPQAPAFRVDSAFGGLGIYRLADALAGHYEGVDGDGNVICEHVPFHRSIAAATGRGFQILPSLLVAAPAAHLDRMRPTPLNALRNVAKMVLDSLRASRLRRQKASAVAVGSQERRRV